MSENPVTSEELPVMLRQFQEERLLPIESGASKLALLLVAGFSAVVFILIIFSYSKIEYLQG